MQISIMFICDFRVLANGPGDRGSIQGRVIHK